jgi:hypothetical protein
MVRIQQGNFGYLARLAIGCLAKPLSVELEFLHGQFPALFFLFRWNFMSVN